MMVIVRNFDNNKEIFAAEVLNYAIQKHNIYNIQIPPGEYILEEDDLSTTDLLYIKVTTEAINYSGFGRMFEVHPISEGGFLLRIKFDVAYDIC